MPIALVIDEFVAAEDAQLVASAFSQLDTVRSYAAAILEVLTDSERELTIFVGNIVLGPRPLTREAVVEARLRGIRFDALVLIGRVDDEESAELTELEYRELLSSHDFDGDGIPALRVEDPRNIDFREVEALALRASVRPDESEETGLDAADWLLVRSAVGSDSRMERLVRAGIVHNHFFLHEVERAIPEVLRYWNRRATVTWLALPNRHLNGATPIDALAIEGADRVLAALQSETWGEFI